jgi:hypothetical protein
VVFHILQLQRLPQVRNRLRMGVTAEAFSAAWYLAHSALPILAAHKVLCELGDLASLRPIGCLGHPSRWCSRTRRPAPGLVYTC